MARNLRLPLFAGLIVAVVGLLAVYLFTGGDENEQTTIESESTASVETSSDTGGDDILSGASGVIIAESDASLIFDQPPSESTDTDLETDSPKVEVKTQDQPKVEVASNEPVASKGKVVVHKVRPGDMVSKLRVMTGTTRAEFAKLNPGVDANKIRIGQELKFYNHKGIRGYDPEPEGGKTTTTTVSGTGTTKTNTGTTTEPPVTVTVEPKKPKGYEIAHKHKLTAGDNYFSLSVHYYGSMSYWRVIEKANDPEWDGVTHTDGQVVLIPALETFLKAEAEVSAPVKSAADGIIPPMK